MTGPVLPDIAGLTVADAVSLDAQAALKLAEIEDSVAPLAIAKLQAEASGLEALAARLRDPAACGVPALLLGHGGETSPLPDSKMPLTMRDVTLTVQARPTMLAAEATMDRLGLARNAGVLTLAVEAAESIGAEGAVQQMLAHEVAAAHKLAKRLMASADTEVGRHERERALGGPSNALADAARSATSAARLMDSVTRAALALDRLRNGARQHVVVQHVVVADGGQAVVAGNMTPRGGVAAPASRLPRGGGVD